jgi:uncharacterized membrane protein
VSHPLVLALFADRTAAAVAARGVRDLGIDRGDLSIVARAHDDEVNLARAVDGTPGAEIEDSRLGSWLGELSGHLLAAIAIVMPGVGPIVTAGPLAAELGETVGHATGGLASTLERAGLSEAAAAGWQSKIEDGAVLLGVHVRTGQESEIRKLLERHGADGVAMANWGG